MNKKQKLKILIIQQSPDFGGAESYMLNLIEEIKRQGNDVILVSNKSKLLTEAQKLNMKTIELPYVLDVIGNYRGLLKSIFFLLPATFFYIELLSTQKKKGIDVVLMSGFSEKMLVSFLSIFFRIPIVWIEYSRLGEIFKRNFYIPKILYMLLSRASKKVIVPTKYAKIGLVEDSVMDSSKIIVLPLGIKLPKVQSKKSKDNFVIGNVSRLTSEKGQQILIEAMTVVVKEIPNAELLLVGEGPDRELFEELIENLKMEEKIKITGFVKDVDSYYKEMDLFVFPTVWKLEGFGLVVIEAMARKIPIIASNINHMDEIITDGKNGILVAPSSKKDLAEKIIKIYKDKKLKEKVVESAHRDVIKKYYIKNVASRTVEIIKESIAN